MTAQSLPRAEREELAALLYGEALPTAQELVDAVRPRAISEHALVTRFAPSPTGFMHIGGLLAALLNHKLARQTGGVFILRIEDTDRAREIEGGTRKIVNALCQVGLVPDEGIYDPRTLAQRGAHGPYVQSERVAIYRAFARELVLRGAAYPCFLTEADIDAIREEQKEAKIPYGIYGSWARCRDFSVAEVRARIARGEPWVLRIRATAGPEDRVIVDDLIRGRLDLAANPIDAVLLKSDGMPTYHFAHPVDDVLMGIRLIIRGDEWISSTPIHAQIFDALGLKRPPIAHIAPVAKLDQGSRRKLSKRKDPEASTDFYDEAGYPAEAILEYLLNLLDPAFEPWRAEHPARPYGEFELAHERLGQSSALLDLVKLESVSREVVATLAPEELLARASAWADQHDPELASALRRDPAYSLRVLNVGRDDQPPRKDLARWRDVRATRGFFFRELFDALRPACYAEMPALALEEKLRILESSGPALASALEMAREPWFAGMKARALEQGYAANDKALRKDPAAFKGTLADYMGVLRVALAGSRQSPDLHAVIAILGAAETLERLELARAHLRG